jgi:Zn-dependent protease with chaperone function
MCAHISCRTPRILRTKSKNINIQLHYLPGNAVIEISQGALDLLKMEELKAVIAHELGHIEQGLWKIRILKLLSSLAFFPNHYLTLCLDWPRYEIEADEFAIRLLHNSQLLKQALVKIATAQTLPQTTQKRWRLPARFYTILIAVRFFFGDALFGYAHPNLSERLAAIDTHHDMQYIER